MTRKWALEWVTLLAIAGTAAACGSSSSTATSSPSAPLRPKVVSQNKLPNPGVTGTFDLVHQVVDYPAGSFGVKHTHAGPVLITVIDGNMTMRYNGVESTVAPGKSFIEQPGKVASAGNNGTGVVRWVADIFVPKGANVSDPVAGAAPIGPAVTPTFVYRWKELSQPGSFDLVQVVQDFEPGAATPRHKHGGPGVITIVEGQLTVRSDGVEKVYKAGDTIIEEAGKVYEGVNTGSTRARNIASFLLPSGATLTTVV
jgi:quercetin dioxygenase-like cupin family protein